MPYREAWSLQRRINQGVKDKTEPETIIVTEHPAVYTLGFHADANNVLADDKALAELGAECIRIERGGDVTFHGPGQIVVYPIISLPEHGLGVKQYVGILEQAVIDTIKEFGITGGRIEGKTGVWVKKDGEPTRKICAIGIKVSRGVTMHGLALNVETDLRWFGLINPCGFDSDSVTSVARLLGEGEVEKEEVKTQLVNALQKLLCNEGNRK